MNYWDKKLIRKQLDKRLRKLDPVRRQKIPPGGWVRSLREALGMTLEELGRRVGHDKSRVYRIEQSEMDGEIKISTLKKMAEGLGVRFVYGFATEKDLEDIVREQARKVAIQRLRRIDHSMRLEEQGLMKEDQETALNDLIDKILIEQPKNFWDE